MKKIILSILILIISVLAGCVLTEESTNTVEELPISEGWEIIVSDTIFMDAQTISLHLLDYNRTWESYVAFDAGLNLLMEFDQNFQLKNSIDLAQGGPNSYGPQCYGITYYQDSLVAISGLNGFYIYNKNWELVHHFKRPDNTFPNVQSTWEIFSVKNENGKEKLLSAYVDETPISGLEELNPLAIATLNASDNQSELSFFGKMDSRSIYLNSSKNYPTNEVMFSYNEKVEHIYKINRLEPIIYVYNKKGELLSLLDIQPEYFDQPLEVDPELTGQDMMDAKRKNDRFMAIYTQDDLIAASYFTGTGPDGVQQLKPHVQFVFNEEIKTNDIEMHAPLMSLAKILPNKKLLFYGVPPEVNENTVIEPDGTVFYVADLVKTR